MRYILLALTAVLALTHGPAAQDATTFEGDAAAETAGTVIGTAELQIKLSGDEQVTSIPFANVAGDAIFEGDIILGTAEELLLLNQFAGADFGRFADAQPEDDTQSGARQLGLRGLAILAQFGGQARRWPQGVVPFVIPPNFPDPQRLTKAMAAWEAKTPVRFVARTQANAATYKDYVVFTAVEEGCSSAVGMSGGPQPIKLSSKCGTGNVVHEIGHALGLGHEQTRNDRDECVIVDYGNIIDSVEYNYNKNPGKYVDKGPYDFDSIVHYGAFGNFNIDPAKPSILIAEGVELPPTVVIGQRTHLSAGDIATISGMYGSPVNTPLPDYCKTP